MKTYVRIPGVFPEQVGEKVFQDLVSIHPAGKINRSVSCLLPADDPRAQAFVDRLNRAGFLPWDDPFRKRKPNEYTFYLDRSYEYVDYDRATYLVPRPTTCFEGLLKEWPGPLRLSRVAIVDDQDIGCGVNGLVVVSERLANILRRSSLKNLLLTPLLIDPGTPEPVSKYFELSTDLVLPALTASCTLFDNKGSSVASGYDGACHIREGFYSVPELHYARRDLEGVGYFDLAYTRERFGNTDRVAYPQLIASQQFRSVLQFLGAKIEWTPVVVES